MSILCDGGSSATQAGLVESAQQCSQIQLRWRLGHYHVPITSSEKLRISVTDTGPGIAAENLTRLFTPFERLAENEPNVEGTGLGLVLAKRLIELMHGQIGVESAPGKGSTFWVELPAAESPVELMRRTGVTRELNVSLAPSQTILYVEDNIANFELIQQVLADYGQFKLLWATDGRTESKPLANIAPI
jgi:hypothetical protein